MLAEIITIGDEILIGQIVDSNSAFIGKELNKIGIDVYQISSIQDDKKHILTALEEAKNRVDIVLITGGLGPTKDDITKHTLCEYLEDTLVEDPEVLEHVENLFEQYIKKPMSPINRKQALVPSKAQVLMNQHGTAPGMWMVKDDTVFISMPGVPFEMKHLVTDEVLPRLQETFDRPYIIHKTILTYGVGESTIATTIEPWEEGLPSFIKLAYLPNLGKVRLRLSARGTDEKYLQQVLQEKIEQLKTYIGDIIVGYEEDEAIEVLIGQLLAKQQQTVAVAESCTGGKIAAAMTAHPGASAYFMGGVVAYASASKVALLGVDEALIAQHSVTSLEVAKAMVVGVKNKFKSDYGIATTGNAGPAKGDGTVEVGTVFIAIATPSGVTAHEFSFSNSRERTIGKTVHKAFELLLKEVRTL